VSYPNLRSVRARLKISYLGNIKIVVEKKACYATRTKNDRKRIRQVRDDEANRTEKNKYK
jgi:hypothetical protein